MDSLEELFLRYFPENPEDVAARELEELLARADREAAEGSCD